MASQSTIGQPDVHVLVVRAGGALWALPMDAVEQTVDLRPLPRCSLGTSTVVLLRGQTLELHDLADALGAGTGEETVAGVTVWAGGRRRMFAIEEPVGQFVLERHEMPAAASGRFGTDVVLLDGEIVPVLAPGAVVGAWSLGDGAALGFSEIQRSALVEVANIGSSHAATALSQMLGRPVEVGYTEALVTTLAEAADRIGAAAEQSAIVDTPVADQGGKVLLLFPEEAAAELCELLGATLDDAVGRSALAEVGNILASSYLNALVEMTGLDLEPEPPTVEIDILGSLVERSLSGIDPSDPTIFMRSYLTVEAADTRFAFMFVPHLERLGAVLDHLGVGNDA